MPTPDPVAIRPADMADAPAMLVVHQASVRHQCASHYSPAHIAAWFHDRDADIYRPALQARQVWLAEAKGRLLGFAGATAGEVTLLFVHPAHTGSGIGRKLFEHAMAQAAVGHAGPLTVVATLNAVAFYRGYGFEVAADDALIRGDQGLRYPLKRMVRAGRSEG